MIIVDRTVFSARYTETMDHRRIVSREAPTRPLDVIRAIMLHQLGFDRGLTYALYDMVIAHFVVLRNGIVLRVRSDETLLNDAHARFSIHIEFASLGADQLASARDMRRGTVGKRVPTWEEVESGRQLVKQLKMKYGIRYIYGHAQFDPVNRANCPGPHIWRSVGLWAMQNHGLSDGSAPNRIPAGWTDPAAEIRPS